MVRILFIASVFLAAVLGFEPVEAYARPIVTSQRPNTTGRIRVYGSRHHSPRYSTAAQRAYDPLRGRGVFTLERNKIESRILDRINAQARYEMDYHKWETKVERARFKERMRKERDRKKELQRQARAEKKQLKKSSKQNNRNENILARRRKLLGTEEPAAEESKDSKATIVTENEKSRSEEASKTADAGEIKKKNTLGASLRRALFHF